MKIMRKIELLVPAGSLANLKAAVSKGADAVYLGMNKFNAREYATNFNEEYLKQAVRICKSNNVKLYLTMNTLVKNEEIKDFFNQLFFAYSSGIDAVIIQEISFAELIKKNFPELKVHVSTQAGVMNSYHANLLEHVDRINLARELQKKEIIEIRQKFRKEIEIFSHGALCVCVSGSCLFSSFLGGRSGNRGKCAQPCRKKYDGSYYLSTKELCLINNIPEIIEIGIDSLKIEGRMRTPYYVASVTETYRKAIEGVYSEKFVVSKEMLKKLESAFSREFTEGKFESKDIFNRFKASGESNALTKETYEVEIKKKDFTRKKEDFSIPFINKFESIAKRLLVRVYNKEDANKSYALGFWGNGDVELNNNQNRRQRTDNFVKEYPELEPIMDEILDRWDNIKNNRDIYLKELQKRYMKYHSPYILMVMAGNEEGDDMLLETMKIYLDKTIMETPLYVSGDAENGKGHYTYLILLCLKHELFESFTYLVDFGAKLDVVDDFGNSVFTVFYDDELGDPNPKGDRNFQKVLKQPENQKMKENIESFKWEIVKKKIEKTAMNKDTKRDFSFSIDGDTVTMIGNDIRDLSLNFKIDQRYWAEKIFKGDFGSEIYDWEFRSDIESILKYYDFDNRTEPILEKIFDSLQPDYEYEDIKEALNDNEELRDALSDTIETAYRYAKETATQNLIENEFEDAIKTEGFEIIWGESKFKKVYNRIDNLNELFIILDKGFNMIFDEDGDDKMYEPFSVDEPRYGWDGDVNDKDFNEYLREKLQNDFYDILNPKEESVVNNEQMKEHFISFKRFITL